MADGEAFVVMQVASVEGPDSQWFDFRQSFFSDPIRVEWDKDTMFAAFPSDTASYLLRQGYARPMTRDEIEAYTAQVEKSIPSFLSRDKPKENEP